MADFCDNGNVRFQAQAHDFTFFQIPVYILTDLILQTNTAVHQRLQAPGVNSFDLGAKYILGIPFNEIGCQNIAYGRQDDAQNKYFKR